MKHIVFVVQRNIDLYSTSIRFAIKKENKIKKIKL